MNKFKILITLLTIIFAFAGCNSCNRKKELPKEKIKIGVILPLTGDAASYGIGLKNGIEIGLAMDTAKVTLIYEDSKADPKLAVNAVTKLVNVDKVQLLLGPFTSSEVLAVAPIAEKNEIVLIAPTASSPALTNAGDYIFRITPSDNFDGQIMSDFLINNLNLKDASVLYVNNDYGIGVSKVFEENFKNLGGTVKDFISYDPSSKDFKSVLSMLKNSKPSSVFLVGMKEMGTIVKQMGELNIKSQVISIGLFEDPEILKTAGAFSNGIYYSFPSFNPDSKDTLTTKFSETFMKAKGTKPSVLDAYGYDLGKLVSQCIGNNQDNLDFKTLLYQTKNFNGVTGTMTFDSNGDVVKSFGIKRVSNGNFDWEITNYQISK